MEFILHIQPHHNRFLSIFCQQECDFTQMRPLKWVQKSAAFLCIRWMSRMHACSPPKDASSLTPFPTRHRRRCGQRLGRWVRGRDMLANTPYVYRLFPCPTITRIWCGRTRYNTYLQRDQNGWELAHDWSRDSTDIRIMVYKWNHVT